MEKKEKKRKEKFLLSWSVFINGTFSLCNNMDSLYWKILYLHIKSIPKENVLNSELRKSLLKSLLALQIFMLPFLLRCSLLVCRGKGFLALTLTPPRWESAG